MIMDTHLIFGEDLAIFGGAGTVNVGDVIDAGDDGAVTSNTVGEWFVEIDEAVVGGTSIEFRIVSSPTTTPAVDGTADLHWSSGAIPVAELVSGWRRVFKLAHASTYDRYLGLQVVRVGTSTAGTVNAAFTINAPNRKSYPEGNS